MTVISVFLPQEENEPAIVLATNKRGEMAQVPVRNKQIAVGDMIKVRVKVL